jgi:hypothetical protein
MPAMRAARPLLVALWLCTGCYTVRDYIVERPWNGGAVPPVTFDLAASELTILSAEGISAMSYEGRKMRAELADALSAVLRTGHGAQPARFRARAVVHREKAWFIAFPCLVIGVYFGCPMASSVATVDLDLEVGGRRFTAQGEASVWQGAYYNADGVRAALARATGEAVNRIGDLASREAAR